MTESKGTISWVIGATLLVVVVLFGIRWMTDLMTKGPILDAKYITVPIVDIMEKGWSFQTAIDYEETKGPAMIWQYAFFGKLLGGSLNDLRLVSLWSSALAFFVLAWIAVRSAVYKRELLYIAVGWLLIPYNMLFSEIVMGEISFLLLSVLAVAFYIWGTQENIPKWKRVLGPVLYCVAITLALHSRIHVVALAGAVCFTAFALQGKQSWPWWIASAVAGLLRIPLWLHWGGLVSPEYQTLHGLGIRLESMAYLAAALVPFVGVFAITGWRIKNARRRICAAFFIGCMLIVVAMPDLSVPDFIDYENNTDRFQGLVATVVLNITSNAYVQQYIFAFLAGIGLAGLAGLFACKEKSARVGSIAFWSLAFGWLLYGFTRGFVFDRFLLTWAFLLPIVWYQVLPKKLLIAQLLLLVVIASILIVNYLTN
ncbi:MAG: hypothetical protein H8E86_02625 [Planctomycetes bacterium]|nr:hypothetical protein [Planctomycetota bacterium]